ncbi:MAG: hypothetical protein HZC24_09870 [Rhodocyclales bacterium]|nr:hypothetical protein [Rhodocyclales bacterium]
MPARQVRRGAAGRLQSGLHAVLVDDRGGAWDEPQVLTPVLEELRRRFDHAAGPAVGAERIARAVAAFRAEGRVAGFVALKHVCLGAAAVDASGACLLAEAPLRERLLELAATVPTRRRQIKCFQCLLRAYWSFPLHGDAVDADALAGLAALRVWLGRRYAELSAAAAPLPAWFATLARHANLLGPEPCARYGPGLLRGDAAELRSAVDGLAIPGDAWVTGEAVLARLRAAETLGDAAWLEVLPQLLDIAAGKAGIAVSETLARRCVALLAARHARCAEVVMHVGLLDAALAAVGNPWQRRAAWDASVLEANGKPAESARAMVAGWLKQRLIADFFALHGGADESAARRAAYWQRYEPFIEALWIGLGKRALERAGEAHEAFRRRAQGLLLGFDEVPASDNALLMRIGQHLVVEFGGGRAMLLLLWSSLDAALTKRLGGDRQKRFFSLGELLQTPLAARFEHRDGVSPEARWEQRCDALMRPVVWAGGGRRAH